MDRREDQWVVRKVRIPSANDVRVPSCTRREAVLAARRGRRIVRAVFLEGTLEEKLRKLEALHAGTTVAGEREAARLAAERIRARLAELRGREVDTVLVYSIHDPWKRRLFVALCRRYGLTPYREPRQRRSTVKVEAPRSFHDNTLWPTYLSFTAELEKHLSELTDRVIREAVHDDVREADESESPKALPEASGTTEAP
jgi:hypothetical protein